MNLTGLAVVAVFLLCIWDGWRKGLVRKLNAIAAVLISSVLVWAMLPVITSFLKNNTPVYEMIVQVCETTISSQFGDTLVSRMSGSGSTSSGSSSQTSSASGTTSGSTSSSSSDGGSTAGNNSGSDEGVIVVNPLGWTSSPEPSEVYEPSGASAVYRTGRRTGISFASAAFTVSGANANGAARMQLTSSLSGVKNSDGTYNRESIRQIMDQYGLDGTRLNSMSDSQIKEYVEQYLSEYLQQFGSSLNLSGSGAVLTQVSGLLNNLTKIEQTRLIQSLPLPASLRRTLLNYNNSEGYSTLGASTFADYIIRFIANLILNILAFIATMLVVNLIVRAILRALDWIANIPGIYIINRIGGLAAGAVQGVLVVWGIFLIISLFSGTDMGIYLLGQIDDSFILRPLYQSNVFLKIVTNAINSIM